MTPESDTHISISDTMTMLGVIDEEIRSEQLQLCDESEARLCTVGARYSTKWSSQHGACS